MRTRQLTIVLTGINGSGKGTLGSLLADWLTNRSDLRAKYIYAPKMTPFTAAQQQTVFMKPDSDLAEMLGYFTQHAESTHQLAKMRSQLPRLHLVVDRGPETAMVYNVLAKGYSADNLALATPIYEQLKATLRPDLTLLLDIDIPTARRRSAQQAETDHIQERPDEYYNLLIKSYHMLARTEPNWAIVDATQSIAGNFAQIVALVEPLLDIER